jgi:hypothetical protein
MSSVEVGYLIDGECSERDITSLAFALAAKRYIRIDRGAEGKTAIRGEKRAISGSRSWLTLRKRKNI